MQVVDYMGQGRFPARANSVSFLPGSCHNPSTLCKSLGWAVALLQAAVKGPRLFSLSTYHSRMRRKSRGSGVGDFYGPSMAVGIIISTTSPCLELEKQANLNCRGEAGRGHVAICPGEGLRELTAGLCHAT